MTKRKYTNPPRKSAVRPLVIDGEATEMDDVEKKAAEMTKSADDTKPLVKSASATDTDKTVKTDMDKNPTQPADKPPAKTANSDSDKPKATAGKTSDTSNAKADKTDKGNKDKAVKDMAGKQGAVKAAKAKSSSGFGSKALITLVILAVAGGAGAWAYREYGGQLYQQTGWSFLAPKQSAADEGMAAKLQALEDNVAANAEKIDLINKVDASAPELPENIAALPDQLGQLQTAIEDLKQAVNENETAISELKSALAAGESQSGENSAVAMAANKLAMDELTSKVAELQQNLAENAEGGAIPTGEAGAALGDKITQLSQGVDTLKQEFSDKTAEINRLSDEVQANKALAEKANQAADSIASAADKMDSLREVMAQLKTKVDAGEAFTDQLNQLAPLMPFSSEVAQLRPFAASGILPDSKLSEGLAEVLKKIQPAPAEPALKQNNENAEVDQPANSATAIAGNLWAEVTGQLSKVVSVRKVGETNWQAIIDKAQNLVNEGNLPAAVEIIREQKTEIPTDLTDWLEQAQKTGTARMAVQRLLQMAGNSAFGGKS